MDICKKHSGQTLQCLSAFPWFYIFTFLGIFFCTLFNGCRETPVYNIGFMGPLSGKDSSYGIPQAKAAEMAFEEFKKRQEENGYQVRLIIKDTEGDPELGVKLAEEMLKEDKIVALLGPSLSRVAMPVADSLLRAQVPMISGSATNTKLTTKSPYIFRTIVSDSLQAKVLGSYIANILNYDNMAILYTNDNYSISLAQDVGKKYELAGGKITLSLEAERDKIQYRDELKLLRDTQPKALFLPNYIEDTVTILQDIQEISWGINVISGETFYIDDLFATLGDLGEGVIFISSVIPELPESINFKNRFQELYGMEPDSYSYNTYDAANIVLGAIRSAHEMEFASINGSSIRKYIQKTKNYSGVSGKINFDNSGDVLKAVTLMQVQGKSFKTLGHLTVIDEQLILLP